MTKASGVPVTGGVVFGGIERVGQLSARHEIRDLIHRTVGRRQAGTSR